MDDREIVIEIDFYPGEPDPITVVINGCRISGEKPVGRFETVTMKTSVRLLEMLLEDVRSRTYIPAE